MKKYKCIKCYEVVKSKEIKPEFKIDSESKIESEINKDNREKFIYQRVCKKCGGPVIEIDPETENHCNQLYKRWKKLERKLLKAQFPSAKGQYESRDGISEEERKEFNRITEELAEKYLDYLSPNGRFDIEQRMVMLGKKIK